VAADLFTVHAPVRALLSDLGISLTSVQYFDLWRAIEGEADDPQLPLTIGRALSVEVFDPPPCAALTCGLPPSGSPRTRS
jgi:hypothetical protein